MKLCEDNAIRRLRHDVLSTVFRPVTRTCLVLGVPLSLAAIYITVWVAGDIPLRIGIAMFVYPLVFALLFWMPPYLALTTRTFWEVTDEGITIREHLKRTRIPLGRIESLQARPFEELPGHTEIRLSWRSREKVLAKAKRPLELEEKMATEEIVVPDDEEALESLFATLKLPKRSEL